MGGSGAEELGEGAAHVWWLFLAPGRGGGALGKGLGGVGDLVVAAQIYFEVQLRALLEEAARTSPSRWSSRLLKERGVAELKRGQSFVAIELLLGVDVVQLPEWSRFQAHVERRNGVVHRGQGVEPDQARDSVAVVRELWMRLAAAARPQSS